MGRVWKECVPCRTVAICVLAGCLAAMSALARAQGVKGQTASPAATVQALFVSDIHFEPFRDPAKTVKLAAAPWSEWEAILAEPDSSDQAARWAEVERSCPGRGEDTAFALYASSLAAMKKDAGNAKFAIVSGDLIAHSFTCKFGAVFPGATPVAYRAFVEKTVAFVLGALRQALPGVPVYAALGNNDSDCGDYRLDANGEFLGAEASDFTRGFPEADREQAVRSFAAGGYYTVNLPAPLQRTRLLVLDDLFMSRRYETCGGKEDHGPATEQMAWLEQQLNVARRRHEKVWMVAHIPPGVDPYSTATKGKNICTENKPTMFLSSEELPETLARYGDVIPLVIFAHTHMDEMRLLTPPEGSTQQKAVAVKMVPSISPVDGNNPAFTLAKIDPATAMMKDYRVIAASNKTGVDTRWSEEYDYAKAYEEPAFSAEALRRLISRFDADRNAETSASRTYIRNYEVGEPMRELNLFWPQYVCALKNDTGEAFAACVCSTMK